MNELDKISRKKPNREIITSTRLCTESLYFKLHCPVVTKHLKYVPPLKLKKPNYSEFKLLRRLSSAMVDI